MYNDDIVTIFERFHRRNSFPRIELDYKNEYTLLVAIVLSARTTDRSVNSITKNLFNVVNSASEMLVLGEDNLKKYISKIGLYNTKAKNIIKLSELIVKHYNSIVPSEFNELIKLPGVGRKSANVFLNSAHGMPTIGVDTHVLRVSNRIGLVQERIPFLVEEKLLSIIPKKYLNFAHHWLVLHGRYICKARYPICNECFIKDLCQYGVKEAKDKKDIDIN